MDWLLYMLANAPWCAIGEVPGEKAKFGWKGPAEVMIGSLSIWNVSRGKGTPGWLGPWPMAEVLGWSSVYSWKSPSPSSPPMPDT